MFKKILGCLLCSMPILVLAQVSRKVLFLGNSYTSMNNLPQIISDFAQSVGDTLVYDSNTPDGWTLQAHLGTGISTNKIITGGFDYVVLQDQSQAPSLEHYDESYAMELCALNKQYHPCARTMFYMTWGRKNGDASYCYFWPPNCTYEGMDSLLSMRYMEMAMQNNAEVSPVGTVWKYVRQNYPHIELYQSDESHPSVAGSYLAACCFYTMLFKKDPAAANYNSSLDPADAADIRQAAKTVIFNDLAAWNFTNADPHTDFNYAIGSGSRELVFTNNSTNADSYLWTFGDGTISTDANPAHHYVLYGNYTITLTSSKCDQSQMNQQTKKLTVNINSLFPSTEIMVYPNPSHGFFIVQIPPASIHMSYRLVDALGKIIRTGKLEKEINDLNLNNVSAGIYFLQIGNTKIKLVKD